MTLLSSISDTSQKTFDRVCRLDRTLQKSEIDSLVNDIAQHIPKTNLSAELKKEVQEFFFDHLSCLSQELFNREILRQNPEIESILLEKETFSRLPHVRCEYETLCQKENASKKEIGALLLDLIELEATFAMELGIKPKSAGATSNAYMLQDIYGNDLAIFKPNSEGPRGKENPTTSARIKRVIAKLLNWNAVRQSRQHVGEEASYRSSLTFDSGIVPPTKICQFSKRILKGEPTEKQLRGSMQVFINGFEPAYKSIKIKPKPAALSILGKVLQNIATKLIPSIFEAYLFSQTKGKVVDSQELCKELFFEMMLLDFTTGQVDRHFENFLIKIDSDESKVKKPERVHIHIDRLFKKSNKSSYLVAIDNGASYTKGFVRTHFEGRHQYYWANLDISSSPLYTFATADERAKKIQKLDEVIQMQDTGLIADFLDCALPEDFAGDVQEVRKTIVDVARSIDSKKQFRTKSELEKLFHSEDPKVRSRSAKICQQLLGMKERSEVLKIFLDPPEATKDSFTVSHLATLKTRSDFQSFWKTFKSLSK